MNKYLCPNEQCEAATIPCYFTDAQDDVECGVCGTHGPTQEVSE